jgi:hypothetical protein
MEEGFSAAEDLDAENLMNNGDQGFSFFEGEQYEKSQVMVRHERGSGQAESVTPNPVHATTDLSDCDEEYVPFEGDWEGKSFSCKVWLGPKDSAPNSALYQYRRLVRVHNVCDGVGLASPSQLRAGAPAGSYIFHTAWTMAIMPLELKAPPKTELESMKDVLDVLKQYRLEGRARLASLKRLAGVQQVKLGEPHFFWTGKLEVSTEQPLPQGRAAQYWR